MIIFYATKFTYHHGKKVTESKNLVTQSKVLLYMKIGMIKNTNTAPFTYATAELF